jgi:glycosyltransferase involved in cell wall biosynthesis
MRGAAMVIAGNLYLAEYAQRAGAARVEVVPTVVDLKRYCAGVRDASVPFTIGWIGSPPTARYLERVAPALAAACQGGRARVVAVGSGPVSLPAVPLEVRPWAHHTEAAEIRRFDVGIMPMPDDPWARGKCGFKLIQYMACGVPVIASPVSANLDIVSHGANGLLAASQDEWIAALEALRVDPQLRERLGTAGRHTVEQRYSLDVTAPRLADLLLQVVQGRVSGYTSAPISGILPGA